MVEFMLSSQMMFVEPDYEREALRYLSKAIIKEYDLGEYGKTLEKRYLDKNVKKYGGYLLLVGKVASEKRITIKWTF